MIIRHRILAELLEQGARSTLTIPVHKPAPPIVINQAMAASQVLNPNNPRGITSNALEIDSMRSLGINPSHALQHPGFYYYMAAKCTEMRRTRFLVAVEAEVSLSEGYGFCFHIVITTAAISTIRHNITGFRQ